MRKPRHIVQFGRYHVIARANRGEFILQNPRIKALFLETITRAKRKFRFSIENFCIMDNHIHLIIVPHRDSSLSRIMQWILSVFALRFNHIFGYKGHVWYDRFKSRVIADLRQFVATFIYIAYNPVKAEIVDTPLQYRFSGVRFLQDGQFGVIEPPTILLRILFPEYMPASIGRQ